jgi:hypothetical protein
MTRQLDKILDVVDRLARDLKSDEYITNKRLVRELRNQYAGFNYINPVIAADFCANSISGYVLQPDGSCKRRYNPILFKIEHNRYIRYQPQLHGSWACFVVNGKKTLIQT